MGIEELSRNPHRKKRVRVGLTRKIYRELLARALIIKQRNSKGKYTKISLLYNFSKTVIIHEHDAKSGDNSKQCSMNKFAHSPKLQRNVDSSKELELNFGKRRHSTQLKALNESL